MSRRWYSLLVFGALVGKPVLGQQINETRPTLPPVEVRPEEEAPLEVKPAEEFETADSFGVPSSRFDLPFSYPSLSGQSFGDANFRGLDGITKSDKSLFDMPGLLSTTVSLIASGPRRCPECCRENSRARR